MTKQDLVGKKIAVLGFGMEGQAITRWLLAQNLVPVIFDEKPFEQWADKDANYLSENKLEIVSGPSYLDTVGNFEIIFRSPGIHRLHPKLLAAEQNGSAITSQAKWFLENTPATVIGVTGTKGKGTTSSLIYEIIKHALESKAFDSTAKLTENSKVYLTGNIGKTQPFEILDTLTENDVVVFELSSFQLQDITKSPQFAVVLMITQDHLDHHKNIDEYVSAKRNLVAHQTAEDFAVINADYPASKEFQQFTPAQVYWVSQKTRSQNGAFISDDGNVTISGFGENISQPFVKLSELMLRGLHNLQNVSAAALVTLKMGIKPEAIHESLIKFVGLEHRLQFVGKASGVSYYDDSFSTVPETTIAAIKAFTEPTILILGGSEKHSNFTELAETIVKSRSIKALIVIGQTTETILKSITDAGGFHGQILKGAASMDEIFAQITGVVESGDVVLLSPACASFGMFENYRERGNQFAQKVQELGGTI